ncbi:MAG: hypothetical protein IBX57_11510 [Gammaproteobacteria bacterium]|nr:hypothetical protein [Gammaproteobacteria bacterium]
MTTKLNFCFKGTRQYVQGPDIVATLFKTMADKSLTQIDLKFNGITKTNLDLVEGQDSDQAKVNIHWLEQGQEAHYQLVENDAPIDCRYEYNEDLIIEKTTLDLASQTIYLKESTGFTLCENFVAMNKHLLQALFPDEAGKWYFTRLEQAKLVDDNALINVKLIKNFNFRLTKSDILLNGEVIGSVYFTMVRGES